MEENNIHDFDAFLTKAVKEIGFEAPSKDFTNLILTKLSLNKEPQLTVYKPLISNVGWVFIFGVLSMVILSAMFYDNDTKVNNGFLKIVDTSFDFRSFINVPNIVLSDTTSYAILGLIIFFYIQVFLFKKHMNKSFTV